MAQSAKLQLRQSQGLALTPQLMQSIKLLQMNAVELNSFVQSEIEKNPLLELSPPTQEFPEERRGRELGQDGGPQSDHNNQNQASQNIEENRPLDLENGSQEWAANSQNDDQSSTDSFAPKSGLSEHGATAPGSGGLEYSGSANDLEAYVASHQSLRDFLTQQAALTFRNNDELRIAHGIIDMIDADGYLRGDLATLVKPPAVDMAAISGILNQVQKFDPPGVGARNLAECMRLQLIEKNRLDPAMRIFTDNLELLARRDYKKLAQLCRVDHQDLIDMAREIQELEPRPGDAFDSTPVQNIVADVFISTKNDGSWHIELNTQTLPKVLINREYYAEIKDLGLKNADRKYMVDSLQSANWLVASLDQRAQTILKVATEIVKQQDMFFVRGKEFLKPLTLKMVAEKIEMHESTVSRVTTNKYLSCDKGIFEFKYFFMSGIGAKDGGVGYGGQSIRLKIQNMIGSETSNSVLSDDKIANLLSEEGIDIARRTVTKYRESLGILSSIQRRRELNARSK